MRSERKAGADQSGPHEERQRISILFYHGSLGGVGVCGMGRRNRRRGGGDWEAGGGPQSLKPSWSTQSKQKAPHGSLVFAASLETRGEPDKKRGGSGPAEETVVSVMEVREVDTLGTYSREKMDRDGLDGWESRGKLSRRWNCEVAGPLWGCEL